MIELAYLSALLEQHPYSTAEPLSHKVEVIRKFLESVVHVVPLESIMYAISYGSHDTALLCSKALMSSRLILPPSILMGQGLVGTCERMELGIPPHVSTKIRRKAKKYVTGSILRTTIGYMSISDEKLQYTIYPRLPGQLIPSPPIAMETESLIGITVTPVNKEAGEYLHKMYDTMQLQLEQQDLQGTAKVVCGLNIDLMYPITTPTQQHKVVLKSPVDILSAGRKELASLASVVQKELEAHPTPLESQLHQRRHYNKEMLETVNRIRREDLATCTSLLGGFMEQQEIDIPLVKSRKDQSEAFELSAEATVGVWALFSLKYSDIQPILTQCRGDQLLVKITDYVKAAVSAQAGADDSQYAAKLQFLVQGMTKTVTCNSQYISYSLEHQLTELCEELKIDATIPLDTLLVKWGRLFKEKTLSLVARSHRPLMARWLKWALMVHNLREELAKYTAVGVAGLVNSGKSKLVNTIFGIQVHINVFTQSCSC